MQKKLEKWKFGQEKVRNLTSKNCVLKSLIGKLIFATAVVRGGRTFLRRLHDATIGCWSMDEKLVMSSEVIEDLKVWQFFLCNYNGKHAMVLLDLLTGFIRSGKLRITQDFRVLHSGKTHFWKKSGKTQENGLRLRKNSGFFYFFIF